MLIERNGQRKRSLQPWFAAPAAGDPKRYYGWNWDPEERKWVETPVSKTSLVVAGEVEDKPEYPPHEPQKAEVSGWKYDEQDGVWNEVPTAHHEGWVEIRRPPKPTLPPTTGRGEDVLGWHYNTETKKWMGVPIPAQHVEWYDERADKPLYKPGHEQKRDVSGWHWDPEDKVWLRTIVAREVVDFEMPRTLPPGVTQAMVDGVYPYADIMRKAQEMFIAQGIPAHDAHQLAVTVIERIKDMMTATSRGGQVERFRNMNIYLKDFSPGMLPGWLMPVVMFIVTNLVAYAIGGILEAITVPIEAFIRLGQPGGQYIMHTEDWLYADFVGRSVEQNVYFASCGSIGTDYVRHKRPEPYGIHDIIDFPGGFVEEGWRWGLFVKYTWDHWIMSYIGMLESVGQNLWQLKKADLKHFGLTGPVWQKKPKDWCPDYRWYL